MARLITVTGAFRNSGDYLIGHRARALLGAHTDHEIIDINRKSITDETYKTLNQAKAVLLTGGPAYQAAIYPGVYDLDLSKIEVPVIPFGLGWKGKLGQTPNEFTFLPEAQKFVKQIHSGAMHSSARDHLTVQMLSNLGMKNVMMTGCPAWYNEDKLAMDFVFKPIQTLVFSMPAVTQETVLPLLKYLAKKFPKAKKYLAFNAGLESTRSKDADLITKWNKKVALLAKLMGFQSVSYQSDFARFVEIQQSVDLHVGFRVHSHIFSLSERIASVLIAEDSRGVGQLQAMGSEVLTSKQSAAEIIQSIDQVVANKGDLVQRAIEQMRGTHPKMLQFISQL